MTTVIERAPLPGERGQLEEYEPACKACGGIETHRDVLRIRRCSDCGAVIR